MVDQPVLQFSKKLLTDCCIHSPLKTSVPVFPTEKIRYISASKFLDIGFWCEVFIHVHSRSSVFFFFFHCYEWNNRMLMLLYCEEMVLTDYCETTPLIADKCLMSRRKRWFCQTKVSSIQLFFWWWVVGWA